MNFKHCQVGDYLYIECVNKFFSDRIQNEINSLLNKMNLALIKGVILDLQLIRGGINSYTVWLNKYISQEQKAPLIPLAIVLPKDPFSQYTINRIIEESPNKISVFTCRTNAMIWMNARNTVLFTSPIVKIMEIFPSFIHAQWEGQINEELIVGGVSKLLDIFEEKKIKGSIVDLREIKENWTFSHEWLLSVAYPRLRELSYKWTAYIAPKDHFAHFSLDMMKDNTPSDYQVFGSLEDGFEWLLSK